MKKDGIQTRKRKPKSSSKSAAKDPHNQQPLQQQPQQQRNQQQRQHQQRNQRQHYFQQQEQNHYMSCETVQMQQPQQHLRQQLRQQQLTSPSMMTNDIVVNHVVNDVTSLLPAQIPRSHDLLDLTLSGSRNGHVTELKPLTSYSSFYSHAGHINSSGLTAGEVPIAGQHSNLPHHGRSSLGGLGAPVSSNTATLLPISSLTTSGRQNLASTAANHISHFNQNIITEVPPTVIGRAFSLESIMLKQEQDAMYAPSPPKAVPVMASEDSSESEVAVQEIYEDYPLSNGIKFPERSSRPAACRTVERDPVPMGKPEAITELVAVDDLSLIKQVIPWLPKRKAEQL